MWILTGGYDQVHLWWQVLQQKAEGIVNRCGINDVVVVEDENEIVRDGGDLIEQSRQNRFGWRRLRGLEQTQHTFSNVRSNRLQGSDEVSQEACWVVIPFVQRKPGGWPLRSEEHTSELQSRQYLVCRLLLEKKLLHTAPRPATHAY